jgi:hypothetical protein
LLAGFLAIRLVNKPYLKSVSLLYGTQRMAHDVFISYSSKDKSMTDAVCARLEANGIRCWMAPRDIVPGSDWSAAVVDAIKASKVLILIFSKHANDSKQVKREVERAVAIGIAVVPFRIEDITPSSSLEYFISSAHWLDALTPPVERHIDKLADAVKGLLKNEPKDPDDHVDSASLEGASGKEDVHMQSLSDKPVPNLQTILLAIAVIALISIVGFAVSAFGNRSENAERNEDDVVSNETDDTASGSPAPNKLNDSNGTASDKPTPTDEVIQNTIAISDYKPEKKLGRFGEVTLNAAMSRIATALKDSLNEHALFEVAVEPFTGPVMSSGSQRLQNALIRHLKDEGITVRGRAPTVVTGSFDLEVLRQESSESLAVGIKARLVNANTRRELSKIEISVADERELSILLGVTASLPPEASLEERQQRLSQALSRPRYEIVGSQMYSGPERLYAMELVSDAQSFTPSIIDDEAVCIIPRGNQFAIRLTNNSPYEASARITVDGLSIFEFSSEIELTGEYLIPPGAVVMVPGWYINSQRTYDFKPNEYPTPLHVSSLSPPPVGIVSVTFAAAWPDDGDRPTDEPPPSKSPANLVTGMGPTLKTEYVRANRTIGVVRGVISVRYGEP